MLHYKYSHTKVIAIAVLCDMKPQFRYSTNDEVHISIDCSFPLKSLVSKMTWRFFFMVLDAVKQFSSHLIWFSFIPLALQLLYKSNFKWIEFELRPFSISRFLCYFEWLENFILSTRITDVLCKIRFTQM